MAVETEIKLAVADVAGFRAKLAALAPAERAGRHFEDNFVLDDAAGSLRGGGRVVRIRIAGGAAILTYKGSSRPDGPFKSREELETTVGDGRVALQIFGELGLRVRFRYQKYRQEYSLGGVVLSLDETPLGSFVELEGSEAEIRRVAGALGYDEGSFLRDSYYALQARACRERGEAVTDLVFSDPEVR